MEKGWIVISGNGAGENGIPLGLSLNKATGVITGTPEEYGTFTVNVQLVNDCGDDDKPITIIICVVPTIQNTDKKVCMIDIEPIVLSATGEDKFTTTWEILGNGTLLNGEDALPKGLELLNGEISGTPEEDGVFPILLKATNECGQSSQKLITISVFKVTKIVTTEAGQFVVGESDNLPFAIEFEGDDATAEWSVLGGAVRIGSTDEWEIVNGDNQPIGLIFNTTTGEISGIPTEGCEDYSITLKLETDCGEDTQEITIIVCEKCEIDAGQVFNGVKGTSFGSQQITFTGCPPVVEDDPDPDPDTYLLTIEVVNDDDDAPIADALVELVDDSDNPISLTDNLDGSWEVMLEDGDYKLSVSKLGFASVVEQPVVINGAPETVEVRLTEE